MSMRPSKRSKDVTDYPITCRVYHDSTEDVVVLELALPSGEVHGGLEIPLGAARNLAGEIAYVASAAIEKKKESVRNAG